MPFSRSVREEALVRSGRRCCLCHRHAGVNLEVHHIVQEADGGPNMIENAIVLCFDCHANVGHYNPHHPRGTKYSPQELRRHRDAWWEWYRQNPHLAIPNDVNSDNASQQSPPPSLLGMHNSQVGDVTTGHIAGRDVNQYNYYLNSAPNRQLQRDLLDAAQTQMMRELYKQTPDGISRSSGALAAWLGWPHQDVLDELKALIMFGLVEKDRYEGDGEIFVLLTSKGRKFCRNNFASPAAPTETISLSQVTHKPSDVEVHILYALARVPEESADVLSDEDIVSSTRLSIRQISKGLKRLSGAGLVKLTEYNAGCAAEITEAGREWVDDLILERLTKLGLLPLDLEILRVMAKEEGAKRSSVTHDVICGHLGITPQELVDRRGPLKNSKCVRLMAGGLGLQSEGRQLVAELGGY
jgi:DNA-binding MarR family transcriptional regulator